jgi:O-antigen ligase
MNQMENIIERRPNSGLTHFSPPPPGVFAIASISIFIILIGLIGMYSMGGGFPTDIQAISTKFKTVDLDVGILMPLLMVGMFLSVIFASIILSRKKYVFFALLVGAFALSEVLVPGVNEASFAIRYIFMVALISTGLASIFGSNVNHQNWISRVGLLYLLWCLLNLFINGVNIESLAMLPMQITLFIGIIIGLRSYFTKLTDIKRLLVMLGWIGAGLTIFNLGALFFVSAPFLAGRYRSAFLLPTNFANGYALLYVAMLWLMITEKKIFLKSILFTCVVIGIVLLGLSGTRNAFVMLLVAISAFALVWRLKIPLFIGLGVIIIAVIMRAFLDDSHSLNYVIDRLGETRTSDRQVVWDLAWNYIGNRPWVGYGIGHGQEAIDKSLPFWLQLNSHNAYLGIWLQTGIIGLVLVVLIYILTLGRALKMLLSKTVDRQTKEVLVLPFALLSGLMVTGLVEENLTSRGSLQQLIWGIAILIISAIHMLRNKLQKEYI